jgi:hypothetical protein
VVALVVVLILLLASIVGFVFAGSSDRIAKGVKIAGVDVSGMTTAQAKLLQHRSAKLEQVPVVFVSGSHRFEITPARLGVKVDWAPRSRPPRIAGVGSGLCAA